MRALATAAAMILAAGAAGACTSAVTSRAAALQRCATSKPEYAATCIQTPDSRTGLQVTDNAGSIGQLGTPFEVTDHNGAPMAWVNITGLWSGGDGRNRDGGAICVSYKTTGAAACLLPDGDLQLTPTDASGPSGAPVTLTPRDIRWLHRRDRATSPAAGK